MLRPTDPKRIVADGHDRLGSAFADWEAARRPDAKQWFQGQVIERLGRGSAVLELGCGPGTAAAELSAERRYIGVDLSEVQLSVARAHVPSATFLRGDLTSIAFRPASFDGIVAFYVFNHVPQQEVGPAFERIFAWLRPGGRLMLSLLTTEAEDRVEEWLGVPMFFAGFEPASGERLLREKGFDLELSEVREEEDPDYGPTQSRWLIAKKPDDAGFHASRAVVDIHPLRPDELAVVSRRLPHRSSERHRSRLERQARGPFTYLIAWEQGAPVGHVGIDWPDDREIESLLECHGQPNVHDLEVLPTSRGRGIGRALMLELERYVRERAIDVIRLSTGLDDGYAAARRLYRSLDFVEVPGSLHVESSILPGHRDQGVYLEILTDWVKRLH
jgi:SAM-dependent methyltransferase